MTFRLTPPPAVLAPLVREAPSRLDPFRLDGPALVSFSGGRTSAYMLRRILDACGGRLPAGVHAVFANTGRERAETLDFVRDCAERWGVHIVWIERDGAEGYREVDYERASRNGEPFAELIAERRYLPNAVARFCTVALKIEVMRDWMRGRGYEHWTNVVGLRADEQRRVSRMREREGRERWDLAFPLHAAGLTVDHVTKFWRAQPFDLRLQSYEGNCDLCFLKGRAKRDRIMREHPELAAWWIDQEAAAQARFHAHERGYAAALDNTRRLPVLPFDLDRTTEALPVAALTDDADDGGIACGCTDRRPARVRCTCHKRPGQGHRMLCPMSPFSRAA